MVILDQHAGVFREQVARFLLLVSSLGDVKSSSTTIFAFAFNHKILGVIDLANLPQLVLSLLTGASKHIVAITDFSGVHESLLGDTELLLLWTCSRILKEQAAIRLICSDFEVASVRYDVSNTTYFVWHRRSNNVSASWIGVLYQIQTKWKNELLILLAKAFDHYLHQLQIILGGPDKLLCNPSEIFVFNMGLEKRHLFFKGNFVVFLINYIHPFF